MPRQPTRGLGPSNMVEQELADYFNRGIQKKRQSTVGSILGTAPDVPPPPAWRPRGYDPVNVNTSEESPWDFVRRIAPEVQGEYTRMHFGPTEGASQLLSTVNSRVADYPTSRLLGAYDSNERQISLNPKLADYNKRGRLDETVAHEMAHAAGYLEHNRELENIEGLMRMARDYNRRR